MNPDRPDPKPFAVDPQGNTVGVAPVERDRIGRPHVFIQVADAERAQVLSVRLDPDHAASIAYALLGAVDRTMEPWSRWKLDG